MQPDRPRQWRMLRRTSWAQPPMQSGRHGQPPRRVSVRGQAAWSVNGSVNSYQMRSAIWSWTISGCETRSAGLSSIADQADLHAISAIRFTATRSGLGNGLSLGYPYSVLLAPGLMRRCVLAGRGTAVVCSFWPPVPSGMTGCSTSLSISSSSCLSFARRCDLQTMVCNSGCNATYL